MACEGEIEEARGMTPSAVEASLLAYSVFYATVSRVPFGIFAVHMVNALGFDYTTAAVTLGLYCFGGLVGAHLIGTFVGSVTMLTGTLAGSFAWVAIITCEGKWVFIASSFILGFTETVPGLEAMLKIESLVLRRTPEQTQMVFQTLQVLQCAGVVPAYMGGGILYERYGMRLVGAVSISLTFANMLLLIIVMARRRVYRQPVIHTDHVADEIDAALRRTRPHRRFVVERSSIGPQGARASLQLISTVEAEVTNEEEEVVKKLSSRTSACIGVSAIISLSSRTSDIDCSDPNREAASRSQLFLSTVVACFFFTTMGMSLQCAICALYWQEAWSVGTDVVGAIMAVGEVLGLCLLLALGHPTIFNSPATRYFGKPANVLVAILGMAVMCCLAATPNQIACVLGTGGIHTCNVCAHTFQAELIVACAKGRNFGSWILRSYLVRRLASCVGVLGSLALFGLLGPQGLYQVCGGVLAVYVCLLGAMYLYLGLMPCQAHKRELPAAQV